MVRDNLARTAAQSEKQNHAAETQSPSQPGEEPAAPEQSPESQEPTQRQLDILHWRKLSLEGEAETWCQPLTEDNVDSWPTHLHPFSSEAEYKLVKSTYQQLQHSGYYWGPMTMEQAHEILTHAPLGTFLIRDSGQPDVFFTLSYQSEDGPTSVRIQLNNLLFSLHGSQRTFDSLFALLTYYTGSACKLRVPYRKQHPERLKQMCRRVLICTYGAETISTLPRLSPQIKDYVLAYPHCI
uniref:Suppressor of cytokine signaling 1b n=1 Tax=Monopterus albus TaxID=43700 RepID=A0A3Q3IHZ0_MONAL|nr:suppressor of cytokine signaling 1-like [Monopterus albus]XP_020470015.1 suppressor of cytokine signaling 1-like [Monopterus albus]XP_020470016.1 suppressor of cytokine signaling 1-like [Monopterus albus]